MALNLDRDAARVSSFAAARLKEKSGLNIERLTSEASKVLGIEDLAAIREALLANWDQINVEAGLGAMKRISAGALSAAFQQLDVGSSALGTRLPGKKTPQAVLSSKQLKAAGTEDARDHEVGKHYFAVHGPEFWDIPPDARLRDSALFRKITEPLVRWQWVLDDGAAKQRGISGAEIEALTKPGPDGGPPALRPGDCLVNGGGGDPSHVAVYVGPDKDGHPMIVHAMATNNEGRSGMERLGDALKLPFQMAGEALGFDTGQKTGVLYERVGDFFNRYHRDTVVVARLPGLKEDQLEKGIARAMELVGKPYDYKLQAGTNAIYCTEVYLEFLKAALGDQKDKLPYMGTSCHSGGSPLGTVGIKDQFICEPSHVLVSPHIEIGAMLGAGADAYEDMKRTHVLGPNAQRKLD